MRDLLQAKRNDNTFSTNKVSNTLFKRVTTKKITWLHDGIVARRSRDSNFKLYTHNCHFVFYNLLLYYFICFLLLISVLVSVFFRLPFPFISRSARAPRTGGTAKAWSTLRTWCPFPSPNYRNNTRNKLNNSVTLHRVRRRSNRPARGRERPRLRPHPQTLTWTTWTWRAAPWFRRSPRSRANEKRRKTITVTAVSFWESVPLVSRHSFVRFRVQTKCDVSMT